MDATGETSEYESDSSIEIITQKPKLPFTPFLQRLVDRGQLHVSGSESQDIAVGRALDAGYSHHPLPEATPYPPPHSGENINADSFGDDFISINNLPGPPRGRVRDRDMLHPLLPARKAPLTNQEKKARKATRKENRARKAALKAERVARGQVVSKAQRRLTRENVERLKTKEFNREERLQSIYPENSNLVWEEDKNGQGRWVGGDASSRNEITKNADNTAAFGGGMLNEPPSSRTAGPDRFTWTKDGKAMLGSRPKSGRVPIQRRGSESGWSMEGNY